MIVAGLVIRSSRQEDAGDQSLTLACVPELRAPCEALHRKHPNWTIHHEMATKTLADLVEGTSDVDGWLTIEPWPAMVNLSKDTKSILIDGQPLAQAPLQIALAESQRNLLPAECAAAPTWKCLVDATGLARAPRPAVKVGIPAPGQGATGLLFLYSATVSFMGRSDFGSNELVSDYGTWRDKLGETTFLNAFFTLPGVSFTAAGIVQGVDTPVNRMDMLSFTDADPPAKGVVTAAAVTGADGASMVAGLAGDSALRAALSDAHWQDPTPDATDDLPDPGILLALLERG